MFELFHIEPDIWGQMEGIARRLGHDVLGGRTVGTLRLEHIPEGIDGAAQGSGCSIGGAVRPQQLDQQVSRNGTRAFCQQNFE